MQVEELTARLGLDNLQATLAGLKEVDRQVNTLREDLRGLTRDAEVAKAALAGVSISDSAIVKQQALNDELRKTRDLSLEIRAAQGRGGGGGVGGAGSVAGFSDPGWQSVARLEQMKRDIESYRATGVERGAFGGVGQGTSTLGRDAESQFRRDATTGGLLAGLFGTQEAKRIAESGGGGGSAGINRGALFGLLPGGARPSQAALTTLLGLAVGGAPAIAPGILAAAPLAGAGVTGLLGAAGTLKLAFDGITGAAFQTQAAFDKLTPVQQQFVQTIRSLDAGLGGTLKGIAQNTLLPQLSTALHTAFSPSAVSSLSGGVGAFSNAIGGGAQQFAGLFGSSGFQDQFGQMLQQDAGYLRQFFTVLTNLTDAFVHFQVAAGPFLQWFGDLNVRFSTYVDNAIKADQANGRLAHFFDIIQTSLQTTGTLLASIGHLAAAFVDAIGFQNSVALVNLLSKAINDLAEFLKANSKAFSDFFGGAVMAAQDMLHLINTILIALHPLLSLVDQLVGGMKGWEAIIDLVAGLWVLRFTGMQTAALSTAGAVGGIRAALLGLNGLVVKYFIVQQVIKNLIPGQKDLGLDFSNSVSPDVTGSRKSPYPKGSENDLIYQAGAMGKSGLLTVPGGGTINLNALTGQNKAEFTAGQADLSSSSAAATTGANSFVSSFLGAVQGIQNQVQTTSSAFGTPGALQQTKVSTGNVLPQQLQTNIDQATFNASQGASTRPEIAALKVAIAWIKAHVGAQTGAARDTYLQEGTSLAGQLAGLIGPGTSGSALLSSGLQKSLAGDAQKINLAKTGGRVSLFGSAEGMYSQAQSLYKNFAKPEVIAPGAKRPYQTPLTAGQEKLFRAWVQKNNVPFDVNAKDVDYDMRGYWLNVILPGVAQWAGGNTHFPDTYKTPFDTRFSNQSMYSTASNPFKWVGQTLVDTRTHQRIADASTPLASVLQGAAYQTVTGALRARGVSGSSIQSLSSSPQIADQVKYLSDLHKGLTDITNQLDKHGLAQKQINALTAEQTTLTDKIKSTTSSITSELNTQIEARKKIAELEKQAAQAAANNRILRVLGLGGNEPSGTVAAARETSQLRTFLNDVLKSAGLAGTGSGALGPFVQELRKNGDINQKQYTSLEKILTAIGLMKGDTGKISSGITGNISTRLSEIKSELNLTTNFFKQGAVNVDQILKAHGLDIPKGETGTNKTALASVAAFLKGYYVPISGGSAQGIPLTRRGTQAMGVSVHGDVAINISGVGKGAKEVANEVYKMFLKQGNRNTTQQVGANGGRNSGMGLG